MTTRNIRRQTRRLSRVEQRQANKELVTHRQQGTGLFIFRNRNDTVLELMKEDADGRTKIPARGEFKGDSYFLQLIPREVSLVKTLTSQDEARAEAEAMKEELMNEHEKLILDQPSTVTQNGTVEHVVTEQPAVVKLNENQPNKQVTNPDVLLNEDPLAGVDIILG